MNAQASGRAGAIGLLVTVVMLGTLGWAALAGDFSREGHFLVHAPWGVATVVDVYAGLALFGAWVLATERNRAIAGVCLLALAGLGNLAAGLYVMYRAAASRGDRQTFWMGVRDDG